MVATTAKWKHVCSRHNGRSWVHANNLYTRLYTLKLVLVWMLPYTVWESISCCWVTGSSSYLMHADIGDAAHLFTCSARRRAAPQAQAAVFYRGRSRVWGAQACAWASGNCKICFKLELLSLLIDCQASR